MNSERDVIVSIKNILNASTRKFGYFHKSNSIQGAQFEDINFGSSQEVQTQNLKLTDLDLFYVAPRIPEYKPETLNLVQEENLYKMFWDHFTDGEYATTIGSELELGTIIIGEEDHNKETKKISEIILYPSMEIAQKAYETGKHYPRIPLSTIEQVRKGSLESKVIRAFPQQKRITI